MALSAAFMPVCMFSGFQPVSRGKMPCFYRFDLAGSKISSLLLVT
ncbi:MAG TPA: hypothetical protein VII44_08970 [Puia sp.]